MTPNISKKELLDVSHGEWTPEIENNLLRIAQQVQVIRDYLTDLFPGDKITVHPTSAYRSCSHERSKGRSGGSQHTKGRALDFYFLINSKRSDKLMQHAYHFISRTFQAGGRCYYRDDYFIHLDIDRPFSIWYSA